MREIEAILKLPRYHDNPGLSRISRFIKGNRIKPNAYTIIVGGTNGKGSVVALLENILVRAGVSVGAMKSPHVYSFNERLTFNGHTIKHDTVTEILRNVRLFFEKKKEEPTFADALTAAGLLYFTKYKTPEVLLLEVGIGGDLDPVNAVRRDISVITNVGHDHANILGEYPVEITRKKAGIIEKQVPAVTGEKNPQALEVILETCSRQEAPFIPASDGELHGIGFDGTDVSYNGDRYTIGIPGYNQVDNAGIVREVVSLLKNSFAIPPLAIYEGMKQTRLPWRMEVFSQSPAIIFDGAHNRESWLNMRETLAYLPYRDLHVVLFVQKTKRPEDFPRSLPGTGITVHLPNLKDKRFYQPIDIKKELQNFEGNIVMYSSLEETIDSAVKNAGIQDLVLFTGSFQIAAKIREFISRSRVEK